MKTKANYEKYGYRDYQEFKSLNNIDDEELMDICDVTRWAIKRYREGSANPSAACIKLVELVKQGKFPHSNWRWEDMRLTPFGLHVPGEKYELTIEELRAYWVQKQTYHYLKNKADFYKRKLEELQSAENIEIVVKVNGHEHKSVEMKPFGEYDYDATPRAAS